MGAPRLQQKRPARRAFTRPLTCAQPLTSSSGCRVQHAVAAPHAQLAALQSPGSGHTHRDHAAQKGQSIEDGEGVLPRAQGSGRRRGRGWRRRRAAQPQRGAAGGRRLGQHNLLPHLPPGQPLAGTTCTLPSKTDLRHAVASPLRREGREGRCWGRPPGSRGHSVVRVPPIHSRRAIHLHAVEIKVARVRHPAGAARDAGRETGTERPVSTLVGRTMAVGQRQGLGRQEECVASLPLFGAPPASAERIQGSTAARNCAGRLWDLHRGATPRRPALRSTAQRECTGQVAGVRATHMKVPYATT